MKTIDLCNATDKLVHAVDMYNSLHTPFLCEEEALAVVQADLAGDNVLLPLRSLVRRVGGEDWDDSNPFAVDVRAAWLVSIAALNEDVDNEEEETLDNLKARARTLIGGNRLRLQFQHLLEDAQIMGASEEELRNALQHFIDTGSVKPIQEFMEPDEYEDEEESFDDRYDDEDAATRIIFNTILSPDFPEFIQAHPEAMKFLL